MGLKISFDCLIIKKYILSDEIAKYQLLQTNTQTVNKQIIKYSVFLVINLKYIQINNVGKRTCYLNFKFERTKTDFKFIFVFSKVRIYE